MKDLVEEIDSRIKSPFFGYFLFSSAAINWEQLFYLIVHNGPVSERIGYFNEGTGIWSLVLLPFLLASAYSIFYPWLQYGFIFVSRKPTELKNSIQAQSESHLLMKKQELERTRSELLKDAEKELIERAKRDAELEEIEDEELRRKLQTEISELRKERDELRGATITTQKSEPTLSPEQEEIIRLITSKGGSMYERELINSLEFDKVRTEYYLEDLENNGFLIKNYDSAPASDYVYSLTTISKKIMVEKGFAK